MTCSSFTFGIKKGLLLISVVPHIATGPPYVNYLHGRLVNWHVVRQGKQCHRQMLFISKSLLVMEEYLPLGPLGVHRRAFHLYGLKANTWCLFHLYLANIKSQSNAFFPFQIMSEGTNHFLTRVNGITILLNCLLARLVLPEVCNTQCKQCRGRRIHFAVQ